MSRAISCPHCDRKLSVRDELVGKRLACPECKGTFEVPAEEVEGAADGPAGGPETDFFDSLSEAPAAGKSPQGPQKPRKPAAQKPAAKSRAAAPRLPRWASMANLKAIPRLAWYIGGGVAAAILLIVIVGFAFRGHSRGKTKTGVVKYGLSEAKRRQAFEEAVRSVDQAGEEKAKKNEWPKIAAGYKIDGDKLAQILEEGFDAGWEQPAFNGYTAEMKARRVDWLKKRNERQMGAAGGRR